MVLVVDDDASVRRLFAHILLMAGYRVEQAADGVSALQLIEDQRPDLVILDIDLPSLSGISVREELTARDPTLDVIFVTGYADSFGDQLRRDCVLRKPVTAHTLLATVRGYLASR